MMIRKYEISDKEQIMQLWLNTNLLAHNFIDENYWKINYDHVAEMLDDAQIYVMDMNHEIKGFIGLMNDMIAGLFVDVNCQSMGIGKQLLDYGKAQKPQLQLCVYKKNQRALNFYLRENFIIESEQLDEATGEIEYLMKWSM